MKIIYSPFHNGSCYFNLQNKEVMLDVQVLETQNLLSQLALHAGIHQQIPSYPERLTSYHKALLQYDTKNVGNIFHRSIAIDSMSVAKTLLRWRDSLAMCGWSKETILNDCTRLNTLAEIDSLYDDGGMATLLKKISGQIHLMESGEAYVPNAYKTLVIEIPCRLEILPDYIKPLLRSLQKIGVKIIENADDTKAVLQTITEIHFTQQWKAEVWLTQQQPQSYDVWINSNNKRLAGHPTIPSSFERELTPSIPLPARVPP